MVEILKKKSGACFYLGVKERKEIYTLQKKLIKN